MFGGDIATSRAATLPTPASLVTRLGAISGEFWRYLAASAVALSCDFGLLWLLTEQAGLHYLASSAISYSAGAVLHYALSVSLVFRNRRLGDRRLEFVLFFAIGLFGLAVTQLVLKAAVDGVGLPYVAGKAAAVGASFMLNFLARRAVLFTAGRLTG
jgi:putative flippase GtrA